MSRDLKVVSAAMLTWGIGESMFLIFQPLYLQQFGADPILIGALLGVNGLIMTLGQVPSGMLADRIGRRPMMWASWILGVVATWVMALAPSLKVFVIGMFFYNVTSSVMAPLNSYIQAARGQWSVGKAVSFASAAFSVGSILGPLIGGALGDAYSLQVVYYAAGVIFIVSSATILMAGSQPVGVHPAQPGEAHLLKNKRYLSMLVVIFLAMFAVILPQSLASNFLQNQRGLSLSQIGRLGSLSGLGGVVLMLLLGHLEAGWAMALGQGTVALFSLLLWRGTGMLWYGLAYLVMGGYRLVRAMTIALVQPLVRKRELGLAFGIVESLNSLAYVAAPIVAAYLYDWKPISIFPVSLAALIVSAGVTLAITRGGRQGEAVAAEDAEAQGWEAQDEA